MSNSTPFSMNITDDKKYSIDRSVSDLAKYICCWIIAIHHYSQYELAHGFSSSPFLKLFSYCGGYIGVAIFFFLSGYGLMKSDQKHPVEVLPFIKRRLLKVYFPVVLTALLWICISFLLNRFESTDFGGGLSILLCEEHLWFVRVIILLYAMFLLHRITDRKLKCSRAFSVSHFVVLTTIVYAFVDYTLGGLASLSIPFFLFGALMADSSIKMLKNVYRGG